MRKILSVFALFSLILTSACASFNPNSTPKMTMDRFKYKETLNGITVGIDPYFSPVKSQGVFDNDFKDHEMLALLVDAEVPEENSYEIVKTDVDIKDGAGKVTKPCDWKEAGQCVGRGYGMSVAWFFIGGIPGAVISAVHTASVNTKIEEDLKAREFKYGPLAAKDNTGFIYYNLEPYKNNFPKTVTANITVQNIKTKEPVNFSISFEPEAGWYGDVPVTEPKAPKAKATPPSSAQSVMGI